VSRQIEDGIVPASMHIPNIHESEQYAINHLARCLLAMEVLVTPLQHVTNQFELRRTAALQRKCKELQETQITKTMEDYAGLTLSDGAPATNARCSRVQLYYFITWKLAPQMSIKHRPTTV
jgi:hypothetical protein